MAEKKETTTTVKKRVSPIVLPTSDEPSKAEMNAAAKKATTTKEPAKKATTTKKATATKKTTTKKPEIKVEAITSTKIDPKTGKLKETKKREKPLGVQPIVEPKKPVKKPKKRSAPKSSEVTIEPAPRDNTPKEIVRPTPKKTHNWNKEEKAMYKQLEESFNTVANLTWVIEERTMDTKNIPDLTLGEVHVLEMVNKYNNKPMTLIAKKLHVTVGALTIGVNRLAQKGYLLRIRDEMDRRVILLSITQQGKKVLKFHDKFHSDILGLVLDTMTLQQATKVMAQFASVLESYYDPSLLEEQQKTNNRKVKK